ncbi:UNVERIFIED_CONTAM: hypothetical protein FKN15_024203 [Acipenser sinensis]
MPCNVSVCKRECMLWKERPAGGCPIRREIRRLGCNQAGVGIEDESCRRRVGSRPPVEAHVKVFSKAKRLMDFIKLPELLRDDDTCYVNHSSDSQTHNGAVIAVKLIVANG